VDLLLRRSTSRAARQLLSLLAKLKQKSATRTREAAMRQSTADLGSLSSLLNLDNAIGQRGNFRIANFRE
jgi:hypothetical protein